MKRPRSANVVGIGCLSLSSGCLCCVAQGTRIATPDGEVTVEDVRIGMTVWSFDPRTGERVAAPIAAIRRARRECCRIVLADGRALVVTSDHPLWNPGRGAYEPAGRWIERRECTLLLALTMQTMNVVAVEAYAGVQEVFDLTVDSPWHNFVAEGVLVHNKSFDGGSFGFHSESDVSGLATWETTPPPDDEPGVTDGSDDSGGSLPKVPLDNLLGEIVEQSHWVEAFLYAGHYDNPCDDCREVYSLEFQLSPQKVVTARMRMYYHDGGSSGKPDGTLYCSENYFATAVHTIAGHDPWQRVMVDFSPFSGACEGVSIDSRVVFERVESEPLVWPELIAWWRTTDGTEPFPGWTTTDEFYLGFPLVACDIDPYVSYCVPTCELDTCNLPDP